LLSEASIEAAAVKVPVSVRTLKGWLKLPEFQEMYRQARQSLLERTVAGLLATCGQAVETLRKNLKCGDHAVENRAAIAILGLAVKGDQIQYERDQQYIRLDLVLEMWRGMLEAIRVHIQDRALVKLIVADVLRLFPAPSGRPELTNETAGGTTVGGVEGRTDDP
jgi:hypothetical protein